MKGDFSRIRFNPAKQYAAVLKQQGRVDLDSDANEQSAIDLNQRGMTNADVIGQYGAPAGPNAGFQISLSANGISIGSGRYYVNGVLVENPSAVSYASQQPWLYNPAYTAEQLLAEVDPENTVQLVLEVWQRLATGLDDPFLLEPALGQADTTARLQTVWRVVGSVIPTNSIPAPDAIDPSNPVTLLAPCCQMLYNNSPAPHTGTLSADTNPSGSDCGCQPIAAAGYQGLENQLYRVEIHTTGPLGVATFKWSRENASVVTQVTSVSANSPVITVSSLGLDANLGFQNGQWVELTDDTYQFGEPANQPGILSQILFVNQATLQVTFTTPVVGIDPSRNARMRRWDQSGASASSQGVPVTSATVPLENGIEITFGGGNYTAGDYWLIPARTANGQIDWPPCGSNGSLFQPASYIPIAQAPLACIQLRSTNSKGSEPGQTTFESFVVSDCRLLFSPLTALNTRVAEAIHVTATSWSNDDILTVDTLLQSGLYVTFDQPPTCPWGGGNFRVTMELPAVADPLVPFQGTYGIQPAGPYTPGTNIFGRTVSAVDPPLGITASGTQVTWIDPEVTTNATIFETGYLYQSFNNALNATAPLGFARVRVQLLGGAVYANGPAGNLYLDGSSFGTTGARAADGSPCVSLIFPTGNELKAADFESWFYLAPSLQIASVVVELLNAAGGVVGSNAITVHSNLFGGITGLETTGTPASPPVAVQTVNIVVTFTYPPVTPTSLFLQLSSTGASSLTAITSPIAVSPGQTTVTAALTVLGNPGLNDAGAPNVDTVTIYGSVAGAVSQVSFTGAAPTVVISGTESSRFGPFGGINLGLQQVDIQNIENLGKAIQESAKPAEAEAQQKPESDKP